MAIVIYALLPAILLLSYGALFSTWIHVAYHPDGRTEQIASRMGLAVLAVYLIWMLFVSIVQRQIPIITMGQISAFLGFLIWADQSYMQIRVPQRMLVLLPAAAVIFFLLIAIVIGVKPEAAPEIMQGPRVAVHVSLSLAGLAMLMGGGVYGAGYLILHRQIKRHSFGQLFGSLPSMDEIHRLRASAVNVAWLLITISLVSASGWMLLMKSRESVIHSHLREMGMLWIALSLLALCERRKWLSQRRIAAATVFFAVIIMIIVLISAGGIYAEAAR